MSNYEPARRLKVLRDPDRARAEASEETVTAVGVQFPSGHIMIEWRQEAFEDGQQTDAPARSHYESVRDAELATKGDIVFEDGESSGE